MKKHPLFITLQFHNFCSAFTGINDNAKSKSRNEKSSFNVKRSPFRSSMLPKAEKTSCISTSSLPQNAPGQHGFTGTGMLGSLLAGSFIGSWLSGGEFTGISIVDIVVAALVIFLLFKLFSRKRPQPPESPYETTDHIQENTTHEEKHSPPHSPQQPSQNVSPPLDPEKEADREGLETAYRVAESMWQHLETPQKRRPEDGTQMPAGFGSEQETTYDAHQSQTSINATGVKGFDEDDFLRGAKLFYAKLQEAWDRRNLEDIRPYTTNEVFQELSQQAKQDPKPGQTDVLLVKAKLINLEQKDGETQCAVQYDAMLREDPTQEATSNVKEIWHFVRSESAPGALWLLAGIEQA
ncbi:TIM44-like domain-containing protein [Desulfovibrio inopinatus]|uniref:TIM44-like domain-containing protein n=1 Tax=Desulfovibrio inopinatus TaxID=102109 RepID=UPI00048072FD|nr:TIM44-like domain-containing protein [Desulfovibrio inopinatus]